jgi:LysR family transcriptional regulator, mexEF-oprN operon transcriptional activator
MDFWRACCNFRGMDSYNYIDLNLLRTLVAVVEERSTVGAARRLFVSQPTVSGALTRLRAMVGDELLVRNGRALEPTARALELLAAVKPHLDAIDVAFKAATPFEPLTAARLFQFGCTDAIALAILPRLNQRLRIEAPNSGLSVRVGDFRVLPAMLATGEISTALAYLRDDPPATAKVKTLRHSPWVVLRDRKQPALRGIDDFCGRFHALVTPSGDMAGFVDETLRKTGRSRKVALGVSSFALLLAALPGSDLIATVPDFVAPQLALLGNLAIDPCPVEVPAVTNTLAWRAAVDRDPGERWFRDLVQTAFAETLGPQETR